MEKNRLYEVLLNLPMLEVLDVSITDKAITIHCQMKAQSHPCPKCGLPCEKVNQRSRRQLRDLDISGRRTVLDLSVRQLHCVPCDVYFNEPLGFASPNKPHTHRQSDYMFCLARKQSYTEVAATVDVCPKTVERTVLGRCAQIIDVPARYRNVRRLGIDEHSHRKGKKDYLCILTDLDRGIIVDMLPDRKKETLMAHFQGLGEAFCQQITDVSCDFWDAYIGTAKACFPNARITLDRFHVTKLLNMPLDGYRKLLRKADKDNPRFKKLKWVLYKQYHTLSDDELDNLDGAFADCPDLKELYWARERFHHVLDNSPNVSSALEGLRRWEEGLSCKIRPHFEGFIKTLNNTKEYIAQFVEGYLSNAVTEGLNNLIRSVRRTAFGMVNFKNLRLRVLAVSM